MEKKMSDEEMLDAMEQAVKMHFMAFQQFMKQTGGDIGLSLPATWRQCLKVRKSRARKKRNC